MTKLTRFFGLCLLVVSLSVVAMADGEGGQLQTPPAPAPTPSAQCVTDETAVTDSTTQPVQDSTIDVDMNLDRFATWLLMSIL